MSESVSISIKLANRAYKIKVAQEKEEHVRKAMQLITDTSAKLKKSFPGRDEQDYLAMTLIDFITTQSDVIQSAAAPTGSSQAQDAELILKLKHISQLLDT
jgi:cell division protein ZapA (FtsZ GTPase activity inhibitor)